MRRKLSTRRQTTDEVHVGCRSLIRRRQQMLTRSDTSILMRHRARKERKSVGAKHDSNRAERRYSQPDNPVQPAIVSVFRGCCVIGAAAKTSHAIQHNTTQHTGNWKEERKKYFIVQFHHYKVPPIFFSLSSSHPFSLPSFFSVSFFSFFLSACTYLSVFFFISTFGVETEQLLNGS